jgi:iron complex transport system ATP-binding protein
VISFDKVSVRYGTALALAEVSEKVPAGQWLGIIGRNGTGKSTLLRAAARLVGHEGTIAIGGKPTDGMRRRALALLVAYVPQLPELPPDMTTLDYVLLGRTPHIGYLRTETDADREICAGLLDRMELTPMAGRTLGTLSGGELQRAVLARALAQDAPVLLLDEPTSALDLGRRVAALELVDELRRERSLTVLSVVHDLTLAGQFADRLLVLDDGRVAITGDPASVLRDDVLARHFGPGLHVLTTPDGERVVVSSRTGTRAHPGQPGPEGLRPPDPGR